MLSEQEKETLLGLMERLSLTPEEKERADALWKNASAWSKVKYCAVDLQNRVWMALHRWRVAWEMTGWRKKKHLNGSIPTKVCYMLRGVLRLPRSE